MYCPKCGGSNLDDSNFCEHCGAPLQTGAPTSEPVFQPERQGSIPVPDSYVLQPDDSKTSTPNSVSQPEPQKPAKKKRPVWLWVVVAVIVLAGIAAGIYWGLGLSHSSGSFQEQLSLGEKYLKELNYDEAIIALNRAIEIDPKSPEPYLLLADVYVAQEEYDSAKNILEQGLAATNGNEKISEKMEEVEELISEEQKPEPTPSPTPTPTPVPTDTASATLEREDRSIKNEAGEVLVDYYYDKLVLEETRPEYSEINRLAQEACDTFFDNLSEEDIDTEMASPEYPFLNTGSGTITCNENGVLSVKLEFEWFMGGVYNVDFSGLNFDLQTGKELELTDIFSMGEDELLQYLHEQTVQYIEQNPDRGWGTSELGGKDAKQIAEEYTLDEYEFYIEGENVWLCYRSYGLGPGAMGSVVVPCPIK